MKTQKGKPWPLGATLDNKGVNFSVFSPHATEIELLLFADTEDTSPQVYQLTAEQHRTYYYWHIYIPGLKKNQLYGYRAHGPYEPHKGIMFDKNKVLVDPYAKAIVGKYDRQLANIYGADNLHSCLKSAVICDDYNWEGEIEVNHDPSKSVVYEMHVAGFTKDKSSGLPDSIRGTYTGLIEKIPYLKKLGISAVELLPVYAYDEQDAYQGLENYWGYTPINFFAVHAGYSSQQKPQDIVDEFKTMVKALHKADIEVILDVVYNHTTENDAFNDGPTLCMRGFANHSYYMLDENGCNRNYTGTGNTINANHSIVRRMIQESLEYWVNKMHVDGFRFDLASVLSRSESGEPIVNPPVLWSIDSHPMLADTKIIAEPWDASGLHQVLNFPGDRWVIWNDGFRDTVRKFVKGDAGQTADFAKRLLGSPNQLQSRHVPFAPTQNLHFVTCHDGFTMYDLVSYNEKYNWANGEENRDGNNQNHSWNCGQEGPTNDPEIEKLRDKQIKNFFAILLLSHGTPMITMGDEVKRTQQGNNNAYCQDNPLAWMDWKQVEEEQELFDFVNHLILYTRKHETFSHPTFYENEINTIVPYTNFHGTQLYQPDLSFESRTLGYEILAPMYNEHFYIILNMYHEPLEFKLPQGNWTYVFDTENGFHNGQVYDDLICPDRTIIMLKKNMK